MTTDRIETEDAPLFAPDHRRVNTIIALPPNPHAHGFPPWRIKKLTRYVTALFAAARSALAEDATLDADEVNSNVLSLKDVLDSRRATLSGTGDYEQTQKMVLDLGFQDAVAFGRKIEARALFMNGRSYRVGCVVATDKLCPPWMLANCDVVLMHADVPPEMAEKFFPAVTWPELDRRPGHAPFIVVDLVPHGVETRAYHVPFAAIGGEEEELKEDDDGGTDNVFADLLAALIVPAAAPGGAPAPAPFSVTDPPRLPEPGSPPAAWAGSGGTGAISGEGSGAGTGTTVDADPEEGDLALYSYGSVLASAPASEGLASEGFSEEGRPAAASE